MVRTVRKIAARTLGSVLALVFVVAGVGLGYRIYWHRELARATAIDPAKGIDEAFFARIGGIDQWIGIRGQSS